MPIQKKLVVLTADADVTIEGLKIPSGSYTATERNAYTSRRGKKSFLPPTYELHLTARDLRTVRGSIEQTLGASLDATRQVQGGCFIVASRNL